MRARWKSMCHLWLRWGNQLYQLWCSRVAHWIQTWLQWNLPWLQWNGLMYGLTNIMNSLSSWFARMCQTVRNRTGLSSLNDNDLFMLLMEHACATLSLTWADLVLRKNKTKERRVLAPFEFPMISQTKQYKTCPSSPRLPRKKENPGTGRKMGTPML